MQNTIIEIRKKNKKGMSEVVGSIFLILLAVTAVSILAYYITSSAKSVQLSPLSKCLDNQLNSEIKIQKACLNKENNNIQLTLYREKESQEINQIKILTKNPDLSIEKWVIGLDCLHCTLPHKGSSETYTLNPDNLQTPKTLSLIINECEITKEVNYC